MAAKSISWGSSKNNNRRLTAFIPKVNNDKANVSALATYRVDDQKDIKIYVSNGQTGVSFVNGNGLDLIYRFGQYEEVIKRPKAITTFIHKSKQFQVKDLVGEIDKNEKKIDKLMKEQLNPYLHSRYLGIESIVPTSIKISQELQSNGRLNITTTESTQPFALEANISNTNIVGNDNNIQTLMANLENSVINSEKGQLALFTSLNGEESVQIVESQQRQLARSVESTSKNEFIQIENWSGNESLQQSRLSIPASQNSYIDDEFSCVGLFVALFDDDQKCTTATACLITADLLLTCSHALYDEFGDICDRFIFIPGCTNRSSRRLYTIEKVQENYLKTTWKDGKLGGSELGRELMVLKLSQPIAVSKYFQIVPFSEMVGNQIKIIGYANSTVIFNSSSGYLEKQSLQRRELEGEYVSVSEEQFRIEHRLDTSTGMSGSPILGRFFKSKGEVVWGIIGIHCRGFRRVGVNNMGLLLTVPLYGCFTNFFGELGQQKEEET